MALSKAVLLILLMILLVASALAVIKSKYNSRQKFIEIQELEKKLDQYEVEWGRLQLEMTTLAEHGRIEKLARTKLGLVMPLREKIIYVKP